MLLEKTYSVSLFVEYMMILRVSFFDFQCITSIWFMWRLEILIDSTSFTLSCWQSSFSWYGIPETSTIQDECMYLPRRLNFFIWLVFLLVFIFWINQVLGFFSVLNFFFLTFLNYSLWMTLRLSKFTFIQLISTFTLSSIFVHMHHFSTFIGDYFEIEV